MSPRQGILDSNRMDILKNILLQNHLEQILEIWYVALQKGVLPSLFKRRSKGPRLPAARESQVRTIEIHRKLLKNLLFQNFLAQVH